MIAKNTSEKDTVDTNQQKSNMSSQQISNHEIPLTAWTLLPVTYHKILAKSR